MAGDEHTKDEALKTPNEADQPTTPLGTREPSPPTSEWSFSDTSLRAIAERYDLLAEVGRGGMGVVYKARDRETKEVVALKVLKPDIAARPDVIERFKTELRLARKITHKNVCRAHDLHRFGDTVVIAMEFVEGESLRSALSRPGGVSLRGGVDWASQICAGLAEAHAQGIVHRDLKPENIVIDRQGRAKVMDFGIAHSFEAEATQTGTVMGTPAYMSPEQAQGNPADTRSDIYSLGLILYEMFIGRQAFKADTPVAYALKQIHDTPAPPREVEPDLPNRIDRAIQKCLEKNPKKRFQSVTELAAALTQKPEAKPAPAAGEEVELPLHLMRWQRSDWLLVLAGIVGLALFFPFFSRTSLAPRSKVSFDRSVLRLKAQEYAQRLRAPIGNRSQIDVEWWAPWYIYVATTAGARAALETANNPIPCWAWQVEWENETSVQVDHRGFLRAFSRGFPPGMAVTRLSPEEAKPFGENALREFFNRDPAGLTLETATNDTWQWYPAASFTWLDPSDYHGLKRRYSAALVGKEIAHLEERYSLPPRELPEFLRVEPVWSMLPVLALDLLLLVPLGFSQRRFVDQSARWRRLAVALAFMLGAWWFWDLLGGPTVTSRIVSSIFLSVFGGLAMALLTFFVLIALERSVKRVAPAKFSTFIHVSDRRAATEPCGLAILRGTLAGLALLGGDAFLVWAGTSYLHMRLDSVVHISLQGIKFLASPWPSVALVPYALVVSVTIMVLISFLYSFSARFVRRPWLTVFIGAAATAVCLPAPLISMSAVQPIYFKLLLLFFECLLLVCVFARYDILTVIWAAFTFSFCWENYFLLIMFEPTGAAEQWIAFAVFGLFVAAAGVIAFKSPLRAAYRRAGAAVE